MDLRKRKVAILIYDGVELLDFAGPFEVFGAARPAPNSPERLMEVFTVAEYEDPIICGNGLVVIPTYTLKSCPRVELLVVPGGQGITTAGNRPKLLDWIAGHRSSTELIASVCTGSLLLARAGLLNGKPATTYWDSIERMREEFPAVAVQEGTRWVDAGNVITSAGASAGIDMALYIVARLHGLEVAAATARSIEYDHWPIGAPSTQP